MDNTVRLESLRKERELAFSKIKSFNDKFCDELSFVETDAFLSSKPFINESEIFEGVLTGYATVNNTPIYLVAQSSVQLGGSLSKAGAEKICKCIDKALRANAPLITVIDSNGARIGEGVSVLEGYASIISAASAIAGEIPHICVIKGNAVGLQATFCALADFVIALPESVYSVATPMSNASKANDVRKSSEILGSKPMLKTGCVHFAPNNEDEAGELIKYLVDYLTLTNRETQDDFNRQTKVSNLSSAKNILDTVCDDKDYKVLSNIEDCIVCSIGWVGEKKVGIVITNGELTDKAIKNATRFINFLDSFNIPLLTFVNSSTVQSSIDVELNGIAETTANLFYSIASTEISKVAVITNKAIGFSYTAFASKNIGFDYVYALPNATVSPVTPEVAVDVLYSQEILSSSDPVSVREKIQNRYEAISDVFTCAKEGYVDNVIEPEQMRAYVISALQMLE